MASLNKEEDGTGLFGPAPFFLVILEVKTGVPAGCANNQSGPQMARRKTEATHGAYAVFLAPWRGRFTLCPDEASMRLKVKMTIEDSDGAAQSAR
jgi:hypothetical protein